MARCPVVSQKSLHRFNHFRLRFKTRVEWWWRMVILRQTGALTFPNNSATKNFHFDQSPLQEESKKEMLAGMILYP